jgi:glutamate synthase (NADPH/NADH) large chain
MVAHVRGVASRRVVDLALTALERLAHRGAVGSDPLTGDGAGILAQLPHRFFARELSFELPAIGDYAVAMVFLPRDEALRASSRAAIERAVLGEGLPILGWRDAPTDDTACGPLALETAPFVAQLFVGATDDLERRVYVARRRIERTARAKNLPIYVASFSSRTIVYKGLLLPERLPLFYRDLADPRFESAVAIAHQRFSTNTFPSWQRAHPYRVLAHNGEINTLGGNKAWMKAREPALRSRLGADYDAVVPVLDESGSDSCMLDNLIELLCRYGRSLPHAMAMAVPEAWQRNPELGDARRAFYEYHASILEPWDGPACLAFSDGRIAGTTLDRNGLRPARWLLTDDDLLIIGSEAGIADVDPKSVVRRSRLGPGEMLVVDLENGRLFENDEVKEALAAQAPYRAWLDEELVRIDDLHTPSFASLPKPFDDRDLNRAQLLFGYTREDLAMLLAPMAASGKEPVGAMGDDMALAILSNKPEPLFHYFKQLFAQVTNPPIDPLREDFVMSLRATLGSGRDLTSATPEHCRQLELDGPILSNARIRQIRAIDERELKARTLEMLFEAHRGSDGLARAVRNLAVAAENAVREGASILILSDRPHDADRAPIPSLLAVSAVHHHLIEVGLRDRTGIVVETGEPREVMHVALLLGYGAAAVNPYVAYETIAALVKTGEVAVDAQTGVEQYVKALHEGLLKVMSKMGISALESYRGAQLFEAVGLASDLCERFFPGTISRLEGIGLREIAACAIERHTRAYAPVPSEIDAGGRYKWRRDGEKHAYDPSAIGLLQHAARSGDYGRFKAFSRIAEREERMQTNLRSLLELAPEAPISVDEVESEASIAARFRTGAMSFGSISKEAHETLALAMNRLGAKSNSGEGGEDPDRFGTDRRSAIKQVASARFGVTPAYLLDADELQIKIAQGAKPGEGGQLPGHKVDETIARLRFSMEGVGLISPPPHHDIYSIEDLAELIHDLKAVNPRARISVKLVSEVGVGTIAAGVAKAGADHILVSCGSGGTGASPLSSIKHAGLPWELGLAEAQETLVMNGLRDRVVLETDGQLKTGRDVMVAALLGAETFGFGTAALVAAGCVMMRVCHLNTCPVGVATQDPILRRRFAGEPEHVINFMTFVAREVRELLASLGARSLDEVVGRADLLRIRREGIRGNARLLDLEPLLHRKAGPPRSNRARASEPNPLSDDRWSKALGPSIDRGEPIAIETAIENSHRAFGARISGAIVERHGAGGLPDDTVRIDARGSAGQSFGAFLAPGVTLTLHGDANDGVGKGMSGGRIAIAGFGRDGDVLAGNAALYGATGGELFVRGRAGERFAVRNSGAIAVVEGVGAHACEYMTRGTVLVLGSVGPNFAAGMSGGVAYALDGETLRARTNYGMADLLEPSDADRIEIVRLLALHLHATGSPTARAMLERIERGSSPFATVTPRELRRIAEQRRESGRPRLRVVHG